MGARLARVVCKCIWNRTYALTSVAGVLSGVNSNCTLCSLAQRNELGNECRFVRASSYGCRFIIQPAEKLAWVSRRAPCSETLFRAMHKRRGKWIELGSKQRACRLVKDDIYMQTTQHVGVSAYAALQRREDLQIHLKMHKKVCPAMPCFCMLHVDTGLKPGDLVLDKYRISARIGEGSNGVTYSGTDNDSGSTVAVKELKLGAMKNWKQFELFEREAATLRGLSHPGIPKYIDYGQADGRVILVQELADGPNLSQMVREGTRFDEAEVERIAKELLIILKYLSSRRPPVIHRDIKPENVVLESGKPGSRVLLVDFGGVQDVVSTASAGDVFGSTIVGTAGYMPAEQFNGQASPASDMYALGGVLLFLLSGRTPGQFASERLRVSFEREIEVAPKLSMLLQALLEPIAEDRPTASQALGILDGTYSPTPSSSKPASPAITPTDSPNRFALQQGQYFTDLPPLARPWRDVSTSRAPSKTRVEVTRADDMLIVDVPPSGLTGGVAANLGFSVIWNVFVGVWTAGALASGGILFALFSVPFWFVGLNTTRQAISSALVHETISISGSEWTLSQALARVSGGVAKFLEGDQKVEAGETSELRGAKVVTTTITNGRPDTAVELLCGRERILVGEGLTLSEQEYCVAVINRHLEKVSGPVEVENDLYPSTQAVIVNSSSSFDRPGSFSSRQRPYDTWEDMDDPFRRRF